MEVKNFEKQFGRVIYVEPNNDINGTGKGTNFTFDPEDYSILVDLQVDVVDRFANVGTGGNIIEYTLEWDAKGTRTTMFRGTNGFLSTNALNTTFADVSNNANEEAIGINSIDIKYNSWNYPEITIQFTDIRGAALLSASDYANSGVDVNGNKTSMVDNFANTFFTTFFRFPYPRYTLIVKGFYGRPVSYSLCVSDFKTRFNSNTGNFDVTVSFIGYMYGLFTDIPMRLLYAAPLSEYFGKRHWEDKVKSGDFVFRGENNTTIDMITLDELYDKVKCFNENVENDKKMKELEETISHEKRKLDALTETVSPQYVLFCDGLGRRIKKNFNFVTADGRVKEGSKYVFVFKAVDEDKESPVESDDDIRNKEELARLISEYNTSDLNDSFQLPMINGIDTRDVDEADNKKSLFGTVIYSGVTSGACNVLEEKLAERSGDLFLRVKVNDYKAVCEFLKSEECKARAAKLLETGGTCVAVGVYDVTDFDNKLNEKKTQLEENYNKEQENFKELSANYFTEKIGFKVNLKNMVDLCLAHLDTFISMVFNCMGTIKKQNRTFNAARLGIDETDVRATTGNNVYLPPFFAFKRKNKNDEYEDAWIGDDPRFSDTNQFQEIELVNGLLNGILGAMNKKDMSPEELGMQLVDNATGGIFGGKFGQEYKSLFVKDYVFGRNPYKKNVTDLESIVGIFALRCLEASIYISKNSGMTSSEKTNYFGLVGELDGLNYTMTEDFSLFKNSSFRGAFKELTSADFLNYITSSGTTDGSKLKNNLCVGNIKTPLFTMAENKEDVYYPSYGNAQAQKYVVPVSYTTVENAVSVANEIYNVDTGQETPPSLNGFGISRKNGMPNINITLDDAGYEGDYPEIMDTFSSAGTSMNKLGWYSKRDWEKYFGVCPKPIGINDEDMVFFPSVISKGKIKSNDYSDSGNLYESGEKSPGKTPFNFSGNNRDLKNFICDNKGYHVESRDLHSYDLFENIWGGNVTVFALGCNDGTLFQHEFYLMQNESIPSEFTGEDEDKFRLYRKAFLFLHSLPTSEKYAFERAVSTFINNSYSPSITNIPYSTALFLGGLYWREKMCEEKSADDVLNYGGKYKISGYKNFVTYYQQRGNNKYDVIRPLSLIKVGNKEKIDYQPIENIFDVTDGIKPLFIDLFMKWADSSFGEIDSSLALKKPDGTVYTPADVSAVSENILNLFSSTGAPKTKNGKDYKDFLKEKFHEDTWKFYCKIGPNSNDNSLMAMFREDTQPVEKINSIVKRGCIISVPFPCALLKQDILTSTDEMQKITVSKNDLVCAWTKFSNTIISGFTEAVKDEESALNTIINVLPANVTANQKLSLYETIKNLHDKWLIATASEKYTFSNKDKKDRGGKRSISDNFYFINSFYEDSGDISLNGEELPKQIESMLKSNDNANSVYSFLYDIANQAFSLQCHLTRLTFLMETQKANMYFSIRKSHQNNLICLEIQMMQIIDINLSMTHLYSLRKMGDKILTFRQHF